MIEGERISEKNKTNGGEEERDLLLLLYHCVSSPQ